MIGRSERSAPLRSRRRAPNLRAVSKDDHIEFDGVVTEVLTGGMFRVKIDDDHIVIAHLAGKMRKFRIKVVLGDRVKVAVSPYDPNRGRIIYRVR
jgi:translation initiation factor IF-1